MSIYKELITNVMNGKKFKIDLKKKNLHIGKKQYIKDGVVLIDDNLIDEDDLANEEILYNCANAKENPWERVSDLYQIFKHSVPNRKYKDKSYFKSLPYDKLTYSELVYGMDRYVAQALLEGYILCASLDDILTWKYGEMWFYQDDEEKELIVMKEWIERR